MSVKYCPYCHKYVEYNELEFVIDGEEERHFYCQECGEWIETIITPCTSI